MSTRWVHSVVWLTAVLAAPESKPRLSLPTLGSAVPTISALTPPRVGVGWPDLDLLVDGSQFTFSSIVRLNGADRPTRFVSSTRLIATISAQDLSSARATGQVTVFNPGTDGGTSNAIVFPILNPSPEITSISPSTAPLQGPDMAITIDGKRFMSLSTVRVNGTPRPVTFVSQSRLTSRILSSDLAAAGPLIVSVSTPGPGGGASAGTVQIVLPTPTITSLTPSVRQFGTGGFTLRVRGSNFVPSATVNWNGSARTTTRVSASELDASIPATDVDVIGVGSVTVVNSAPNAASQVSASSLFMVASPAPTFVGIPSPLPVMRMQPVEMTFGGTNFLPTMRATVNNVDRPTTVVNPTTVRVTLDAADVAAAGQIVVRLINPIPTMGVASSTLGVVNPVPVASSLSPRNVYVGGQAFTLTVNGSGFVPGATVRANGTDRPTTFVSKTQLTAAVPASDLTTGGDLPIRVVTPAPGGGTSAQLVVTRLYQNVIVK